MTARTDLDKALVYLSDGITAHVARLKSTRDSAAAHALAAAAANDDTYTLSVLETVVALTAALSASLGTHEPVAAVAPATLTVEAPVAPVAPVIDTAVAVAPDAPAVQSVADVMAAVVAMQKNAI